MSTPSPYAPVVIPFDARDQIERALLGRTTIGGAAAVMSLLMQWPCTAPVSSSEDTPAREQQWAVRHPDVSLSVHRSPHSVLYTASKLPGGVIVTRASDQDEWRDETDCLCGDSKPADRHFQGCPGVTPARVWQEGDDPGADRALLADARPALRPQRLPAHRRAPVHVDPRWRPLQGLAVRGVPRWNSWSGSADPTPCPLRWLTPPTRGPSPMPDAALPTWEEMTDRDKHEALWHVWKRESEGKDYAVENYPAMYRDHPVLVDLDEEEACDHAKAVVGSVDEAFDRMGPDEYARLLDLDPDVED